MLAILDCLKNFKLPKESKCIIFFYRLIIKGYKKALEETDISDLHPRDKNDVVIPEFEKAWKAEYKKHEPVKEFVLLYKYQRKIYIKCKQRNLKIHCHFSNFFISGNHIGGVMLKMFAWGVVDHGFKPWSDQTKTYTIDIYCFSAIKHAALRRKSKDWLAWVQYNVPKWSNMSTCRLLFQLAVTVKIHLIVLV
jgi:hypothetical protein